MTNEISPLDTVELGSTALAETGRFGASIIEPGLTHWNPISYRHDMITTNSSYLHQANTNEASLAISGGYGVSGVAKLSAGVSAYVGRSKSDEERHLSITMKSMLVAGTEIIAFDYLSLEDLIGGLAPDVQDDLESVLGKYIAAVAAGEEHRDESGSPTEAFVATSQFIEWIAAKENFFRNYGDAVVVGVLWGGHGEVQLTFDGITDEVMWKAGGKANFSFASPEGSVQVDAAFGHTEMSNDQQKSGQVERRSSGKCVDAIFDAWAKTLSDTLLDETKDIGKTNLSKLEGKAADIKDQPKLLDPKKPKNESIASKIGEIKDLGGLEAFAKASAYDAYKKKAGDKAKSLHDFLAETGDKNDTSALPSGPISPLDNQDTGGDDAVSLGLVSDSSPGQSMLGQLATKNTDQTNSNVSPASIKLQGYTALGAWMIEWGQLFPWLVEAQDNTVSASSDPEARATMRGLIKLRTLQSDLTALSRIYRRLDAEGIKIPSLNLDFKEISNEFQHAAKMALELMQEHLSKLGGKYSAAELTEKLTALIDGLGLYKKIYKVWCDTPVLRDAELGFGLWVLKMSSHWKKQGVHGLTRHADWTGFVYNSASFDPHLGKPNYSTFASQVKAWPAILPSGEIVMFMSDGTRQTSGLITATENLAGGCHLQKDKIAGAKQIKKEGQDNEFHAEWQNTLVFSPNNFYAVSALHAYTVEKTSDGRKMCEIFAFPIPFNAADGIEWEGSSPTPGLDDLKAQLSHVSDALGGLKRWSFGSDNWVASDWNPEHARRRLQSLKPMYVGLVPEPEGLFFHASRQN